MTILAPVDARHYNAKQETGVVPEEFSIKVKATTAVQKVSEMEAQDHLEATELAQSTVEETGMEVQVQVPQGAMPGQQVPCQTAAGMPAHMITIPTNASVSSGSPSNCATHSKFNWCFWAAVRHY